MTIGSLTTSGGNSDGASSTIRAASGTIRAGGVVTLAVRGGLAGVTTVSRSVSGVQEVVLRVPAVLVDVGGGGVGRVAILAVLIVVELSAYVLVTAGGGMLLVTLVRKGFGSFRLALRKLTMMVPLAFLLLVIGAWYEAAVLILPRLLGQQ